MLTCTTSPQRPKFARGRKLLHLKMRPTALSVLLPKGFKMTTITDPARDLAELCERVRENNAAVGSVVLAKKFDVAPWSAEFFQILFVIHERFNELIEIVDLLEMDQDILVQAKASIETLQKAFGQDGVNNHWNHSVGNYISPAQVLPLKMLSASVREKKAFRKLSKEECKDAVDEVDQLLGWLNQHQLQAHDFIRAALIEGLEKFKFRLLRLDWLGWGYSLQSLREVVGAYMALEGAFESAGSQPDLGVLLSKVSTFLKSIVEKAGFTKDVVELGKVGLQVYGAIAVSNSAPEAVQAIVAAITGD